MAQGGAPPVVDSAAVAERIETLEARLAAASGGRTRLLPVTKAFGPDAVRAVLATGRRSVGENYAQELVTKAVNLGGGPDGLIVDWHMIGGVQRNKVRLLGDLVGLWQTVDRVALVDELARRVPGARILVQVDTAETVGKRGCKPGEVSDLVERATDAGLVVAGLMTIGVQGDLSATDTSFRLVARMADDLGLEERSMGMTDDLDQAVEHGSTMVRVGRALFGERPPRAAG